MYSIYKAKKLKIKIFKPNVFGYLPSSGLKKMTVHTYIYMLCNSRWEKFGDIRNSNWGEIVGSLAPQRSYACGMFVLMREHAK